MPGDLMTEHDDSTHDQSTGGVVIQLFPNGQDDTPPRPSGGAGIVVHRKFAADVTPPVRRLAA